MTSPREIIRVIDSDDREYDNFFYAPEGMSDRDAVALVDEAIRSVRLVNPEDYTFDDVQTVLEAQGFTVCYLTTAMERW